MAESPTAALRRKPNASIKVAANWSHAAKRLRRFSAGHAGASVAAAHASVQDDSAPTVRRWRRPSPREASRPSCSDGGAGGGVPSGAPVAVAAMGGVYAHVALIAERPRVMLSIGEEETKGNDLTPAHRLPGASLNFIGNIERRDVWLQRRKP